MPTSGPLCAEARRHGVGWEVLAEAELALVPGGPMVLTTPPSIASEDFDARERMIVRGGAQPVAVLTADGRPLWSSESPYAPVSTLRGDEWVVFVHRDVEFRSRLPDIRASLRVGQGHHASAMPMTPVALVVDLDASQCVLVWRGVAPAVPAEQLEVELLHHGAPVRSSPSSSPTAGTPPFDATVVLAEVDAPPSFDVTVVGASAQSMKAPFPMAAAGDEVSEGSTIPGAPWSDETERHVTSPPENLESTVCLGDASEAVEAARQRAVDEEAREAAEARERAEALEEEEQRHAERAAAQARREADEQRFLAEQREADLAEERRRTEAERRRRKRAAKLKSDLYGGFKRRP